jgi:hypothetical protein
VAERYLSREQTENLKLNPALQAITMRLQD